MDGETITKYGAALLSAAFVALVISSIFSQLSHGPRPVEWAPFESSNVVLSDEGEPLTGNVGRRWSEHDMRWHFRKWSHDDQIEYEKKRWMF